MRVLLVEDDRTIGDFVEKGLREAGFAVDRAADGTSGLERAMAEAFDVAIVDVMLPRDRRPGADRQRCARAACACRS